MPWYFYNNRGVVQQDGPPDPYPVGIVTAYVVAGGGVPATPYGWLLCNGAPVSSAAYPELYTALTGAPAPIVPVNFNLPLMNQVLPVGSGLSYPLGSTDTALHRRQHKHGGSSPVPHSHSNDHRHSIGTHRHGYSHQHGSVHTHSTGTLNVVSEGPGEETATAGTDHTIAAGYNSGSSHDHTVSGFSDVSGSSDVMLELTTPLTSYDGADATSSISSSVMGSVNAPISTPADILPPYLNVYFIIKAVDLSGVYI